MNDIGLSALISPHAPDLFLNGPWPQEPFIVHELGSTISELTSIPFLKSLDAMLEHWPSIVQAHLPDVADESSAVDVSPRDARKLFTNKMALLFNNVEQQSPVLKKWLAVLARDLGLPMSTYGRCIVYATPDGKGTAAHFDQNVNFVLQLHGTKKWWLAPNSSVVNPTERFTIGQPLDPELATQVEAEMPIEMPSERKEFVLNPGSMLFVPRGYWHSTEARGEALALNFTFNQPTFSDLFVMALKSRLSLSPEWRALADGVTSVNLARREAATAQLDALLLELVHDMPNWRAEDILGATEGLPQEEFS